MDILTLGEALICFAPVVGRLGGPAPLAPSIGGAEFNTAVGLARLGNAVSWCSRVGTDPFGDAIVERAKHEGISTQLVSRVPAWPTGVMFKDRSSPDHARVFYYRQASAASNLTVGDLSDVDITSARHVHVTGISMWIGPSAAALVLKVLRTARDAGITVTFDPNFRPQLASADSMLAATLEIMPFITTFLCNESEATAITGLGDPLDAAAAISALGPTTVIVKRGAMGVVAIVDGASYVQPAWQVQVPLDPIGAGDAFNAGWIHAQLKGFPPPLALRLSSFVAAQVVAHENDHDGFPALSEVSSWLTEQGVPNPRQPISDRTPTA